MAANNRLSTILNLLGLAVIAFVVIYLTAPLFLDVRSAEVNLHPESIAPDGRSRAELTVAFLNGFGMAIDDEDRTVVFEIVEGHASASWLATSKQSAVLQAGMVPGLVRIQVFVEGFALPQEVVLTVEAQLT